MNHPKYAVPASERLADLRERMATVQKLLDAIGLRQIGPTAACRAMSISRQSLQLWRTGVTVPTRATCDRIEKYLAQLDKRV